METEDDKFIRDTREKHMIQQQMEKRQAQLATEMAAHEFLARIETCVQEICKLENAIQDRVSTDGDPTGKLTQKERKLDEDIERLRTYYADERQKAKERYEIALKHLNDTEKTSIAKREEEKRDIAEKRNSPSVSPMVKKLSRELKEKIEQYPNLLRSWSVDNNGRFPSNTKLPPGDYKQHSTYKKKRGVTESAVPEKLQLENKLEIPKSQFQEKPATQNKKSDLLPPPGGGVKNDFQNDPPLKVSEPPSQQIQISKPARVRKTVAIAENASGSMFNGINIISSAKRPPVTFTLLVPGKKWIDYSSEERSNMSHYDAYTLEFEWKAQLAAEKERKDREWKAKLSREEDEAEADAIRDMRKAEEAEKEWEELEED
jgi:hypothetical protein